MPPKGRGAAAAGGKKKKKKDESSSEEESEESDYSEEESSSSSEEEESEAEPSSTESEQNEEDGASVSGASDMVVDTPKGKEGGGGGGKKRAVPATTTTTTTTGTDTGSSSNKKKKPTPTPTSTKTAAAAAPSPPAAGAGGGGGGMVEVDVPPPTPEPTPSSASVSSASSSAAAAPSTEKKKKTKKSPTPTTTTKKSPTPKEATATKTAAAGGGGAGGGGGKKAPATDAKGIVLEYMQQQARPYGVQNVFDNLHKKIGKTAVQTILDQLADSGQLTRKEFGKSKVYFATPEAIEPTELATHTHTLTQRAESLKGEKMGLLQKKGGLDAQVKGLNDAMDDATLLSTLTTLRSETHTHTQKLATLRAAAGSGKPLLDKTQLAKLQKDYVRVRGMWVSRKRKVMDVIGQIADGQNKSNKALIDTMGIETDEEAGATIPPVDV